MGRFLLVEMAPDLERFGTTHDGVFLSLKHVNGVLTVCDLAAISMDTLNTLLLPDDQAYHPNPPPPRGDRNNVRAYMKRVRSPRLPECG